MATSEAKKTGISEEQQQELDDVFSRAQKALAIIETYDQERVDRLCQAVAWAVLQQKDFHPPGGDGHRGKPAWATPRAAWANA